MKKLFRAFTAVALAAAGATCSLFGLSACGGKSQAGEEPSDTQITRLEPPRDGSLPTAHTAEENLAYLAYVLDNQPSYHCYTYTVTQASIATQYTKSYKDYRDGITISSDITYSSMVKSGTQACFVEGANGPEAYMRTSSAPSSDTTNLTAQWSTGQPSYFDEKSYLTTYGLFQTEMTNYIINSLTITDSTAAEYNGDGTYTQSVVLDPVASTYYYQYGMKTRGGLNGFPEFETVNLSFTFDENWQVLTIEVDELAKVNKGVTVTSKSRSMAEYSYDAADFDEQHFAFYDGYFKEYVGSQSLVPGGDVQTSPDIATILSNGFSEVLGGGQQFELDLALGDSRYKGYIFLGLDLADPANSLNIKLSLGRTLAEQGLYIEYSDGSARAYCGKDFALTANIAAVKLVAEEFMNWAEELGLALSSPQFNLSDGALEELLSSFELVSDETSASLSLASGDLLGLGLGLSASLDFDIDEGGAISFASAEVSGLSFGGEGIDLSLALSATDAPVIDREHTGAEGELSDYAADIFSLLDSDLVAAEIAIDGDSDSVKLPALKGIAGKVTAYADAGGRAAGAVADVNYTYGGNSYSATLEAHYSYDPSTYGRIIMRLTSINGVATDIALGCDVAELADGVNTLLSLADIELNGLEAGNGLSLSLAGIINGALSLDFSEILGGLTADKAKITLTADLDGIISAFAPYCGVSFGTVGLVYNYGGGEGGVLSAALPALGLTLTVRGAEGELEEPPAQYTDLSDIIEVVQKAWSVIDGIARDEAINIVIPSGGNTLTYGSASLAVTGTVSARWGSSPRVAADLNVGFAGREGEAQTNVMLIYNAEAEGDEPLVRLSINGAALDIRSSDLGGVQSQIDGLALATSQISEGSEGLVALLLDMLAGGGWVEFLNDLTLTADGQSLALSYLGDIAAGVRVDVSDGLALDVSADLNGLSYDGTFSLVDADIYSYVNRQIDKSSPLSTADGDNIIKVVYDYVIDAFNAVDLSDVLGGAYTVGLRLDGDNSAIPSLAGIKADAKITFSQYSEGVNAADLAADIEYRGLSASFSVTLIGEDVYARITRIGDRQIPSLKVSTSSDSLFSLIGSLSAYAAQGSALSAKEQAAYADILYTLITLDWNEYIMISAGEDAAVIVDADGLLSAFGGEAGFMIGSLSASFNKDSGFAVSAEYEGREWAALTAGLSDEDITSFDFNGYIDFSAVTSLPLADILGLFSSDNLSLSIALEKDEVKLGAKVYFSLSGGALAADINICYLYQNRPVTANLSAFFDGETVYLRATDIAGIPCNVALYCSADDLAEGVAALLSAAQLELGGLQAGVDEGISSMLSSLLSADFSSLITGVYGDGSRLSANIDADFLLSVLGVSLPFSAGELSLAFEGGKLSGDMRELGLSLELRGEGAIPAFDTSDCLDLAGTIRNVIDIIEGKIYSVEVAFDGSETSEAALNDLLVRLDGAVSLADGARASAELYAEYGAISARISARYEAREGGNYVYLVVKEINGKAASIAVMCEVGELTAATEALISAINAQSALSSAGADLSAAEDVISALLSADLKKIVTALTADGTGINVAVDLDELFAAANVSLPSLGQLTFNYPAGGDRAYASLEKWGASFSVGSCQGNADFTLPDAEYLDLTDLINFVTKAYYGVNGILREEAVAFEVPYSSPAYITVDGITASLWGRGEISWKGSAPYVALDLSFALAEGVGRDEMTFKLVYDGNASENEPFVTFAVNNVGAAVRQADAAGIKSKIDEIVKSVAVLRGKNDVSPARIYGTQPYISSGAENDDLVYAILSVLSRTDWAEALGNLTLSCDGSSLVLGMLEGASCGVTVDEGGLVLTYGAAASGDGASFETGARITLSRSSHKLGSALLEELKGSDYLIATSGGEGFIKNVYDNLFEAIRSVSVSDILGDKVYNVSFDLNGSYTSVPELEGVFVHAEMYVKNNAYGGSTVQLDLNFNIGGAVVNGSVIIENDRLGADTRFYIDLTRVLNITLNGLKVSASQQTLYDTLSALVDVICDTDILQSFASPSQGAAALSLTDGQKSSAAGMLCALLNLDFSSLITGATAGGVTTAVIDLDGILSGLGLDIGSLGAVECTINHKTHSITSSAVARGEEREWLSLSSRRLNEGEINSLTYALSRIDTAKYIDLEFLPTLVNDLRASVTQDGQMYPNMTFSGGTLNAKIVSILEVTISNLTLTVNFDPAHFYLALQGDLSGAMVTRRTIGLTYQNGYLTLYRGDNGGEYRVMTFEYFIDNLFADGETSTLNWLLGVKLVWGLVSGLVPEVSSGLATPGSLWFYGADSSAAEEEISVNDYVNALSVVLGGEEVLDFSMPGGSTQSLVSNLGLGANANYYAFDLNASLLTDGVLTALSAAILRDGNGGGITSVTAYGAIQSYVTFTLDLNYSGANNSSPLGSHFDAASEGFEEYAEGGAICDGPDRIFGCYNSADNSVSFSQLLTAYTLKVNNLDGSTQNYTVREGTKVYLYSNYHPVYADGSGQFRLVYSKDGELCTGFTVTGDAEVTALKRAAVQFDVRNSMPYAEGFVYNSFIGDTLPAQFEGVTSMGGYAFSEDGTPSAGRVVDEYTPREIVGAFAPSVVSSGSVVYTLDGEDASYHVSGTEAGFVQLYSDSSSVLRLEGSIGGVPVTAIDADAFALDSADAQKSLKNIVIPASITSVGERAFLNNAGMLSAVFLADGVTVYGGGENAPFYGCASSVGADTTSLKVYYAQISGADDWSAYRSGGRIGSQGGELHSGDWAYVSGAQVFCDILPDDLTIDGLTFKAYAEQLVTDGVVLTSRFEESCEALRATLQEALDAYTLKDSNRTSVYEVSVVVGGTGREESYYISVLEGSPVENVPVTVVSRIDFTYGATKYAFDDANGYTSDMLVEVRDGAIINAKTPQAMGYVFLGWATERDGVMSFVPFEDANLKYYAVWAVEKEGVTYSVQTSGTSVDMPVLSSGAFYGWYADAAYANLISLEEQVALSPENTVFNLRRQFSMGISISGGTDDGLRNKKSYFYIDGAKVGEGKSYSGGAYAVLEGEKVSLSRYTDGSESGYVISAQSGSVKVCAWLMSRSSWFGSWSKSSCHAIASDHSSLTVGGDISINFSIS